MSEPANAARKSPYEMTRRQLEDLYQAQCSLTDQIAAKLEAGSDKALLARIAELESDMARMNARYVEVQGMNNFDKGRRAGLKEAAIICDEFNAGWYAQRKGAAQCAESIRSREAGFSDEDAEDKSLLRIEAERNAEALELAFYNSTSDLDNKYGMMYTAGIIRRLLLALKAEGK